jgi:hypothetical protein
MPQLKAPDFHPRPDTEQLKALLIAAGYSPYVAEPLAENSHNPDSAQHLSIRETLDVTLTWHGIIGFTDCILDTIQHLLDVKPEWADQVLPESMQ